MCSTVGFLEFGEIRVGHSLFQLGDAGRSHLIVLGEVRVGGQVFGHHFAFEILMEKAFSKAKTDVQEVDAFGSQSLSIVSLIFFGLIFWRMRRRTRRQVKYVPVFYPPRILSEPILRHSRQKFGAQLPLTLRSQRLMSNPTKLRVKRARVASNRAVDKGAA